MPTRAQLNKIDKSLGRAERLQRELVSQKTLLSDFIEETFNEVGEVLLVPHNSNFVFNPQNTEYVVEVRDMIEACQSGEEINLEWFKENSIF